MKRYQLNYGWGDKNWDDRRSDVMLEAVVEPGNKEVVLDAINKWLESKDRDRDKIRGKLIDYFYEGGSKMYTVVGENISVFFHSHGQDAFDSIHWYAGELFDAVGAVSKNSKIKWIEHKHKREQVAF